MILVYKKKKSNGTITNNSNGSTRDKKNVYTVVDEQGVTFRKPLLARIKKKVQEHNSTSPRHPNQKDK